MNTVGPRRTRNWRIRELGKVPKFRRTRGNPLVPGNVFVAGSVTVSIAWTSRHPFPVCELDIAYNNGTSIYQQPFTMDPSMTVSLYGLRFSQNHTIDLYPRMSTKLNRSSYATLRFTTFACHDLTEDLYCDPPSVRSLGWGEDERGGWTLRWIYDQSVVSPRLSFYFLVTVHPVTSAYIVDCGEIEQSRFLLGQDVRHLNVRGSEQHCIYEARISVIDSLNRTSTSLSRRNVAIIRVASDHWNTQETFVWVVLLWLFVMTILSLCIWTVVKGRIPQFHPNTNAVPANGSNLLATDHPHSSGQDFPNRTNENNLQVGTAHQNFDQGRTEDSVWHNGFGGDNVISVATDSGDRGSISPSDDDFSSYIPFIRSSTSDAASSVGSIMSRIDSMATSVLDRSIQWRTQSNRLQQESASSCPHTRLKAIDVVLMSDVVVINRLGTGHFGTVDRIYLRSSSLQAALKHVEGTKGSKGNLYREADAALHLCTSGHRNIVTLIAFCYETNSPSRFHGLVFECCEGGDLKSLLKQMNKRARELRVRGSEIHSSIRNSAISTISADKYSTIDKRVSVAKQLLRFALQVSMALEYIGSLRYVHRDLAARNVLLTKRHLTDPFDILDGQTVKITDFGMCVALGEADEVIQKQKRSVPFRWLPYEFWIHSTYGLKGDVWEYGCFLIELLTFGGDPCVVVQCNEVYRPRDDIQEYVSRLSTGSTAFDDLLCSQLIPLISDCLRINKEERPSFTDISCYLRSRVSDRPIVV